MLLKEIRLKNSRLLLSFTLIPKYYQPLIQLKVETNITIGYTTSSVRFTRTETNSKTTTLTALAGLLAGAALCCAQAVICNKILTTGSRQTWYIFHYNWFTSNLVHHSLQMVHVKPGTSLITTGSRQTWYIIHYNWFTSNLVHHSLAGSLGLSCIRPQITAAILLLGPRSDENRRMLGIFINMLCMN